MHESPRSHQSSLHNKRVKSVYSRLKRVALPCLYQFLLVKKSDSHVLTWATQLEGFISPFKQQTPQTETPAPMFLYKIFIIPEQSCWNMLDKQSYHITVDHQWWLYQGHSCEQVWQSNKWPSFGVANNKSSIPGSVLQSLWTSMRYKRINRLLNFPAEVKSVNLLLLSLGLSASQQIECIITSKVTLQISRGSWPGLIEWWYLLYNMFPRPWKIRFSASKHGLRSNLDSIQ